MNTHKPRSGDRCKRHANTCRRSATLYVAKPTDLGLKSEALACRCSATLCFKSADDSQFDALIWSWPHLRASPFGGFHAIKDVEQLLNFLRMLREQVRRFTAIGFQIVKLHRRSTRFGLHLSRL